jgi:hypothetical protein
LLGLEHESKMEKRHIGRCSIDTDIDIANMGHACLSSRPLFGSRCHHDLGTPA